MDVTNTPLRVARDIAFQSIGPGEETVVINLSSGQLYTCNDTAQSFLKALDGKASFAEVVQRLAEQYDVVKDRLTEDLRDLAEDLLEQGIIVKDGRR